MDCEEARALFSEYYDGVLAAQAREKFEEHRAECPDCAARYENYRALFDEVHALSAPEMPEGLWAGVTEKALAGTAQNRNRFTAFWTKTRPNMKLRPIAWAAGGTAACFIFLSLLVSSITGLMEASDLSRPAASGMPLEAALMAGTAEGAPMQISAGHIIQPASPPVNAQAELNAGDTAELLSAGYFQQNYNITVWVQDLAQAQAAINEMNGYNLTANTYDNMNADYQRRVDIAAYGTVIAELKTLGEVKSESETVYKLADEVYDLEARLRAKEDEAERLKGLLQQSRTMDVLAAVESRLGAVESERDNIRGRLNQLYDISSMPYINITLVQITPPPEPLPEATFSSRLGQRFIHSLNDLVWFMESFLVWLSGAAIPLIIITALALLLAALLKRYVRREKKGAEGDDTIE